VEFAEFLSAQADALTYLDYIAAARGTVPADAAPLRIALLRNVTVEPLVPVISGELLRAGFAPDVHLGEFDAIAAETLAVDAPVYAYAPDFIVLTQWLETLSPTFATRFTALDGAAAAAEIERIAQLLAMQIAALRRGTRAPILINNFPLPAHPTLGILDAQQDAGETQSRLALNARVREIAAAAADVFVVDLMRISAELGEAAFFDAKQWQIARQPFGRRALIALGQTIAAFVRALRGRTRKCLVLDCDNTLWGGVIGEDGIAGIALGSTYPGSCFTALQRAALNLHDRGVILALCSKNDESEVLTVLREHPEMLIREEHLAAWEINWDDKAANLRRLAQRLNIGLDALVFVDDNPFEINLVRGALPEVATLLLPKDRAALADALAGCDLFDSLTLTDDDRRRTASYKANAQRAELQASSTNIEEYLRSLDIVLRFGAPGPTEIPRVAQLSQKTNQFNLTTRRYSEDEIAALCAADDADVWVMRARDAASELGLVGVIVMRRAGETAEIESCFISCRALGRGLEDAFFAAAANAAFADPRIARVIGRYVPTAKNGLCRDFYQKLGLAPGGGEDGPTVWTLARAAQPVPAPAWITIESPPAIELVR